MDREAADEAPPGDMEFHEALEELPRAEDDGEESDFQTPRNREDQEYATRPAAMNGEEGDPKRTEEELAEEVVSDLAPSLAAADAMKAAARSGAEAGSDEEGTSAGSSRTGSVAEAEAAVGLCRATAVCDTTRPGESLALLGAHAALGAWDPKRAVVMTTSAASYPTWSTEIPSAASGSEFKLVIVEAGGGVTWEPIAGNRVWTAGHGGASVAMGTFGRFD